MNVSKCLAIAAAFILLSHPASAQERFVTDEIEFIDYLVGNDMASDAFTLLSQDCYHASDTLEYLRGWAGYSARMLEEASEHFSKVSQNSGYFDKSLFFNVISNAHLGRYDSCSALLDSYSGPMKELQSLEKAGIALLRDRPDEYLLAERDFSFSQYAFTASEEQLRSIYQDRYCAKGKSPAVAAIASAVVPGLGKIYAGELGEGLSSLLVIGSMAAITAENWVRNGPANWKTILFGTVSTVFYIGNIYGSYVSVSIHNNDLRNAQDTAILYHIHIPLRSSFN